MGSKLDVHSERFLQVLVGRQLALSVSVTCAVVAVLGALPVANLLWPDALSAVVLGLPLAWLLLGVAVFPLLCAMGALYLHYSADLEDLAVGVVDVATMPTPADTARTRRNVA